MASCSSKTVRALLFLSLLLAACAQEDKPFPKLTDIEVEFYTTEVQVTDFTEQATAYAKEYFDYSEPRGRVEVLVSGFRQSVFYYGETKEIIEVAGSGCNAWDVEESAYDYTPMWYGWLNKDPLIIGPSAALWYAQDKSPTYNGTADVRGIKCDKFSLEVTGPRENVVLYFYFADSAWTTPYKTEKLIVPVRIEAIGASSKEVEKPEDMVPVNVTTDFAYFRPTISEWGVFQPPEGVGCPARKSTRTMPSIPKVFKYSAEVYDVLKASLKAESDVEYNRVWYDSVNKLARLDKYSKLRYISEVYDFNTGVTYSQINDETCTIQPLRNSMFEKYATKRLMGSMKDPEDVLGLDGDFYYLGKKRTRGLVVDVFEKARTDVDYNGQDLAKLVTTVYFTEEFTDIVVNGETETKVPIYVLYTGYNSTNSVVLKKQLNIFGFSDVIFPELYKSFQINRCFPNAEDKSYFVLVMEAPDNIKAKMEELDDVVIEQLRDKISEAAGISDLRLPMLKADYKTIGVYVSGLMVNRPAALTQFWMENEGLVTTHDPDIKFSIDADTKEKCAVACVDEQDFTCNGFYFCNNACIMKSRDILEEGKKDDKTTVMGMTCQTWLRAEWQSTNDESYLKDALKKLQYAVMNSTLKVTLSISEKEEAEIPVEDIFIGDGPYTGQDNAEKLYSEVIKYAKLNSGDETTQEAAVTTLNDCYQACKKSESMSCASFSYCPEADNNECMISSVLILDREKNPKDTVDDKNCYVYSLKYLDLFDPYPGRVFLISGEENIPKTDSAEHCARSCREKKEFQCRGFEYCQKSKTCVLHSKHILDLKPGEITTTSKKIECIHFAAKFTADYDDMGYTLVDDDKDVQTDISLEKCAQICSVEKKDQCRSFNFCPPSDMYSTDSTCSISNKVLADKDATTTTKKLCHHYEKKKNVDDWLANAKKNAKASGFASGTFAGLVIGMLALGLILGAVGFVTYSYFKSRRSGEGMSVRFMKSDM